MMDDIKDLWIRFWMHFSGLTRFGRIATRLATWLTPPYYDRCYLAGYNSQGYIAPTATIHHVTLRLGANVFIGDHVVIFQHFNGGPVELGDRVHLYDGNHIQTGQEGSVTIGADTHIHPHCQFSAYKASIRIGRGVQIAPCCAFYPYDHGCAPGEPIVSQPLQTKGDIVIDDGAWLGYGVIVLSGVRIGRGAVIGAGSVVTNSIPDNAIAVGSPARIVKMRGNITTWPEMASFMDRKQTDNQRF